MAVLSESHIVNVWESLMRDNQETMAINKNDLKAAVVALDQFLENNAGTVNNAFPAAAKAGLTAQQKALIVAYVALRRYGVI